MASWEGFLKGAGGSAEQLFIWGVLSSVIGALGAPYLQALQQAMMEADPNTPLSPEAAAGLTARAILDPAGARDQAAKSGLNGELTNKLIEAAGRAPDLGAVYELLRRGKIPAAGGGATTASLAGALTDAGIHESWRPVLAELATQIPSVAEVMNAWLEGQIEHDEAHRRYLEAGGDPTWFQTSFDANGQAPTPSQALELLNRGIIPERGTGPRSISYEQAFLEGPWRNKWLTPFLALREYLPPPRTITAMYHDKQINEQRAAELLTKQGLAPDLVAAYLAPTSGTKTSQDKELAKGEVLTLYGDGLLTKPEATKHLTALHYTHADAELLLRLTDVKVTTAQLRSGITRIRTLFQHGKLSRKDSLAALAELHVAGPQATQLVDTWSIAPQAELKTLTAAQVESAWYYNLLDTGDALDRLGRLGYDAGDAWLLLAVRGHGPLKGYPRPPELGADPKAGGSA